MMVTMNRLINLGRFYRPGQFVWWEIIDFQFIGYCHNIIVLIGSFKIRTTIRYR